MTLSTRIPGIEVTAWEYPISLEKKNTYSINVFLMVTIAGEPMHFGVMLHAILYVPRLGNTKVFNSNWATSNRKKNLPGSQGRKPYDWKTIQKSNTTVKEWYFKNHVCETFEVTPPEKQGRHSLMIDQSVISIAPLPCESRLPGRSSLWLVWNLSSWCGCTPSEHP